MAVRDGRAGPDDATNSADKVTELKAIPLRHPLQWLATGVLCLFLAVTVNFLVTNPRWQWGVVAEYLFRHDILRGVQRTILLTALAFGLGLILGVALAVMRLSHNPVLAWFSRIYIVLLRSVPPLVLLLFIYFFSALQPELSIGIPFGGAQFASAPTNTVITQMSAAVIGLGLVEAAYVAEIVRGGILSVSPGQSRAALALGLTPAQVLRRVILPQAMRVAIPPLGNELISGFKATSLVSVIAYAELLTTVQVIYARNFQQIPLLVVACFWYLVLTLAATLLQAVIEARLTGSRASRSGSRSRRDR